MSPRVGNLYDHPRHHLVRIEPFDLLSGRSVVRSRFRSNSDFPHVAIQVQPLLTDRRAHHVSHEPLGRAGILGLHGHGVMD